MGEFFKIARTDEGATGRARMVEIDGKQIATAWFNHDLCDCATFTSRSATPLIGFTTNRNTGCR